MDNLPPRKSPQPPVPPSEEGTDPGFTVTVEYVKKKLVEVHEQAKAEGHKEGKLRGIMWGLGLVVASIGLAFAVWFKAEASAQTMATKAKEDAIAVSDAGMDKKLAPIAIDLAVLKNDVSTLKKQGEDNEKKQDQIIRLLQEQKRRGQ